MRISYEYNVKIGYKILNRQSDVVPRPLPVS